jgi:ABC-type glutathione transport system ATPase component
MAGEFAPRRGGPAVKLVPIETAATVKDGLFADSISKTFRGRAVVKNVSLRLGRGEVAGLLGPNGAGKTTCFYMITGLIPVDRGAIFIDGEDITAQPMYQRARMGVGYLPQEASIICAPRRRCLCQAVSGGAWKSLGPSPATPTSCCWTSRSRGSTPSPSPTSAM